MSDALLSRPCRSCGAPEGEPCRMAGGLVGYHAARLGGPELGLRLAPADAPRVLVFVPGPDGRLVGGRVDDPARRVMEAVLAWDVAVNPDRRVSDEHELESLVASVLVAVGMGEVV